METQIVNRTNIRGKRSDIKGQFLINTCKERQIEQMLEVSIFVFVFWPLSALCRWRLENKLNNSNDFLFKCIVSLKDEKRLKSIWNYENNSNNKWEWKSIVCNKAFDWSITANQCSALINHIQKQSYLLRDQTKELGEHNNSLIIYKNLKWREF